MKLRIKGNTLRLRLSQSDIRAFEKKGFVGQVIKFGNSSFHQMHYMLQKSDTDEVTASYNLNQMVVHIPELLANNWINSDLVGFSHQININDDEKLSILVEKDFQCLQPRPNEDEMDLYPNPKTDAFKN